MEKHSTLIERLSAFSLLGERLVSAPSSKAYITGLPANISMIRVRLELTTVHLEGGCSIQLSYRTVPVYYI